MRTVLITLILAVGLTAGIAAAQEAAAPEAAAPAPEQGGSLLQPFKVLAMGFGMAVAAGLCGLGQGRATAASVEATARQPGAAGPIFRNMILGLALIESLAIYMFVIAILLLFLV